MAKVKGIHVTMASAAITLGLATAMFAFFNTTPMGIYEWHTHIRTEVTDLSAIQEDIVEWQKSEKADSIRRRHDRRIKGCLGSGASFDDCVIRVEAEEAIARDRARQHRAGETH